MGRPQAGCHVDLFESLPKDLQEEIFQHLCDYDSDWMRQTSTIAQDILSLGLTCKAAHAVQNIGLRNLARHCPKMPERSKPSWLLAFNPIDPVSDSHWDTFVSEPTSLSLDTLDTMYFSLPAVVTQGTHDLWLSRRCRPKTDSAQQEVKRSLIDKLQRALGIQTAINGVPSRVLAAVKAERRIQLSLTLSRKRWSRSKTRIQYADERSNEIYKMARVVLSKLPYGPADCFSAFCVRSAFRKFGCYTDKDIHARLKKLQDKSGKSKKQLLGEEWTLVCVP